MWGFCGKSVSVYKLIWFQFLLPLDMILKANGFATKAPPRKTITAFLVQAKFIFQLC